MKTFSLQFRTVRKPGEKQLTDKPGSPSAAIREKIIRRAALEFKDGMYACLGIGMDANFPCLLGNPYNPPFNS